LWGYKNYLLSLSARTLWNNQLYLNKLGKYIIITIFEKVNLVNQFGKPNW